MKKQKLPSLLGGSMIIAGTAIGAGMLANPTSMSGIWFVGSVVMLLFTWFYTVVAGLMILEANLHFPEGANFNTMVTHLLGKGWNIANGLAVTFTLYILTYAYITSGGGITENFLHWVAPQLDINHKESSLLFCFALALFVSISTKAVSRLSTILITGMIIAFFLSTTGLLSSSKKAVNFWMIIIPALLARACRKKFPNSNYKVFGGNWMIYVVILFGSLNIFRFIASQMDWTPTFKEE